MSAIHSANTVNVHSQVKWLSVALAMLAALAYVLIALGVLPIGDFSQSEGPAGIVYTAAGCYLLGGLLILAQRRWLWVIGAVINAMVIFFFVQLYQNRPEILFSAGGLASKAAQILLEVALVYLIASYSTQRRLLHG